jgi:hypothetical protein
MNKADRMTPKSGQQFVLMLCMTGEYVLGPSRSHGGSAVQAGEIPSIRVCIRTGRSAGHMEARPRARAFLKQVPRPRNSA